MSVLLYLVCIKVNLVFSLPLSPSPSLSLSSVSVSHFLSISPSQTYAVFLTPLFESRVALTKLNPCLFSLLNQAFFSTFLIQPASCSITLQNCATHGKFLSIRVIIYEWAIDLQLACPVTSHIILSVIPLGSQYKQITQ